MTIFNINENIKVKLTDLGYKVLVDDHNEYLGVIPNWKKADIDFFKKNADEDGYYTFQLRSFMNKFGKHTIMGSSSYFVDNNIILDI